MRAPNIVSRAEFHGMDVERFEPLEDLVKRKLRQQRREYTNSQGALLIDGPYLPSRQS